MFHFLTSESHICSDVFRSYKGETLARNKDKTLAGNELK